MTKTNSLLVACAALAMSFAANPANAHDGMHHRMMMHHHGMMMHRHGMMMHHRMMMHDRMMMHHHGMMRHRMMHHHMM